MTWYDIYHTNRFLIGIEPSERATFNRPQTIRHHVDANASFEDGRFWLSDVPSRRFT
jgi:hypothetical protein